VIRADQTEVDELVPAHGDRESRMCRHILAMAAATFDRLGLRRATMDDIAEAASVSRKTIYNYYESKAKLIGEVIAHESMRVAMAALERLDLSAPAEDLVVDAEMAWLETARESRYVRLLLHPEALEISAKVLEQSERIALVQRRFWAPVLEPLREAGRLRVDDIDELVEWLTLQHFVLLARPATFHGDDEVTRRMLRTYLVPSILRSDDAR
jgi:AcrR family transcriptional regulator